MNSDKLSKQIYERMRDKSSEELLTIWKENDRGLWSDEAFKAIEEILSSRKMPLPAQGQIKKTVPQLQPLEESWEKPFISWAFYILFLEIMKSLYILLYICLETNMEHCMCSEIK